MEYNVGAKVFDEWIIKRPLGEGANGKVFEIEKSSFGVNTQSALKVIRIPKSVSDIKDAMSEGLDEQSVSGYFRGFVEEIVKEIAVMTSLKGHPHIVSCEDHRVVEHTESIGWDILIRMELLTPLTDYQIKHPLSEQEVLRLGKEIAAALVYCQKQGMIHRDIKPQNVFISKTGQFKLGDFGVARTVEKTMSGLSRKGTESYMAPEVYKNEEYGPSVDIYSLGLMLYGLLNHGRLPFLPLPPVVPKYADREEALARRMRGDTMPMPACASEEFAYVILKACQYDPKKRFRTAEELLAALNGLQLQAVTKQTVTSQHAVETENTNRKESTLDQDRWEDEEEKTVSAWDKEKSTAGSSRSKGQRHHQEEIFEDRTNDFEDRTVSAWDSYQKKDVPEKMVQPPKQKKKGKGGLVAAVIAIAVLGAVGGAVLGSGSDRGEENYDQKEHYYGGEEQTKDQINQETEDNRPTYIVTVWDGEGSGSYHVGDQVTVTANAPAGYEFVGWTMPTKEQDEFSASWYERAQEFLGDANLATVSFAMPQKEVKLQAFYVKSDELQMRQMWMNAHCLYENGIQWFGSDFRNTTLEALADKVQGNGFLFFNGSGYASEPDWAYSKQMITIKAEYNGEAEYDSEIFYQPGYSLQWKTSLENAEVLERMNTYAPASGGIRLGDGMSSVLQTLGISEDMIQWVKDNNTSTLDSEAKVQWKGPEGNWYVYYSQQSGHISIRTYCQTEDGDMSIRLQFGQKTDKDWNLMSVSLDYKD